MAKYLSSTNFGIGSLPLNHDGGGVNGPSMWKDVPCSWDSDSHCQDISNALSVLYIPHKPSENPNKIISSKVSMELRRAQNS